MGATKASKSVKATSGIRKGTKFLAPKGSPIGDGTECKYVAEDSGVVYLSYEAEGNGLKNDSVIRVHQIRYFSVPVSTFDSYERPT